METFRVVFFFFLCSRFSSQLLCRLKSHNKVFSGAVGFCRGATLNNKQGGTQGVRAVRGGTSSIHSHRMVPLSCSHIGPRVWGRAGERACCAKLLGRGVGAGPDIHWSCSSLKRVDRGALWQQHCLEELRRQRVCLANNQDARVRTNWLLSLLGPSLRERMEKWKDRFSSRTCNFCGFPIGQFPTSGKRNSRTVLKISMILWRKRSPVQMIWLIFLENHMDQEA